MEEISRERAAAVKTAVRDDVSRSASALGHDPDEAELTEMIEEALASVAAVGLADMDEEALGRLRAEVADDFLRLGPLSALMRDPDVTEICVNAADAVFAERGGVMVRETQVAFDDEAHLRRIIDRIASAVDRRIDEQSPALDARLADGSRVNAVIPPIAIGGSSLCIRRFPADRMTSHDLIERGTASPAMMEFLAAAVAGRCSIVVAGGTGGGKTTILNVLSAAIPAHERIVTIEDVAELSFAHDNIKSFEARPANSEGAGEFTIHDALVNALRQRPDRIVVGECRDVEALEMIRAMTTGHDGSLTTVHADDVTTVYDNLQNMIVKAVPSYDRAACRSLIASAIKLIVIVNRKKGGARIIESISAVCGMEGTSIQTEPLFEFVQHGFLSDHTPAGAFRGCARQPADVKARIEEWGAHYNPEWMFDEYERQPFKDGGRS